MDPWDFRREDWMVGGGGVLLIACLLAVPFYSYTFGPYTYNPPAISSPGSIWGILALLVTVLVVGDWVLASFSPQTHVPTSQLGREMTRVAAAAAVVVLILFKLILHTGYLGLGCLLDLLLAALVAYGAEQIARRTRPPTGGAPRRRRSAT